VTNAGVDGADLVRRYLDDVFSHGNLGAMDQYLRGETFMASVAELVETWRSAFSDFTEIVKAVYVDGDQVITVSELTGTHDGVLASRLGPIDPTGRHVTWSRIAIRRLDGDRFVDGFFEQDELGLLQQLGALHANDGPGRGRHAPLANPPERAR
jgi:predicted ester cyclase